MSPTRRSIKKEQEAKRAAAESGGAFLRAEKGKAREGIAAEAVRAKQAGRAENSTAEVVDPDKTGEIPLRAIQERLEEAAQSGEQVVQSGEQVAHSGEQVAQNVREVTQNTQQVAGSTASASTAELPAAESPTFESPVAESAAQGAAAKSTTVGSAAAKSAAPGSAAAKGAAAGSAADQAPSRDTSSSRKTSAESADGTQDASVKRGRRRSVKKQLKVGKIVSRVTLLVMFVAVALVATWSAFRWAIYDDAADLQGDWQVYGSTAVITLDGTQMQLASDVAYNYTIDATAKTISYSFGTLVGGGHYRFNNDRTMLAIIEDGTHVWTYTAMQDVAWLFENMVSIVKGESVLPAQQDKNVTILVRYNGTTQNVDTGAGLQNASGENGEQVNEEGGEQVGVEGGKAEGGRAEGASVDDGNIAAATNTPAAAASPASCRPE